MKKGDLRCRLSALRIRLVVAAYRDYQGTMRRIRRLQRLALRISGPGLCDLIMATGAAVRTCMLADRQSGFRSYQADGEIRGLAPVAGNPVLRPRR